jgi:hypothetical protein
MKPLAMAVVLAAVGCHRGGGNAADLPSSCLIEHDGGVTQCFDDIGSGAKSEGEKACGTMHGVHTFRAGTACPTDGVIASCTKASGTELERVERCYRDEAACTARCAKGNGVLNKP